MIDVYTSCGIAVTAGAAWTYAVYRFARRGMIPYADYDHAETLHKKKWESASSAIAELSATREKLALRDRKFQMLEENHQMLERQFNDSVTKQSEQSEIIESLKEENELLKQDIEAFKTAKRRVRVAK